MECRKCGKILSEQEKFCTYCGYYNDPNETIDDDGEDLEESAKTSLKENVQEDYEIESVMFEGTEKLKPRCLKAYLSTDFKTVMSGGFNIYALLFSWIYFIYKKMYLIGIIGLIIAVVLFIYQQIVLIIYAVLSMTVSGILFNKIYLMNANKKVDNIIKNNKNPKDAIRKSKKAGRENILLTLIIYFIFLMTLVFLYASGGSIGNKNDRFWKENGSNKATCLSMIETAKNVSNTNSVAFLREAGCIVVDAQNTKYQLYLKFDKGNKTIIEKYVTEVRSIVYDGSTDLLMDYESKKATLNDSELSYYQEMIEIEADYQKIIQQSKIEEDEIANKINTRTRVYFILNEEEVNR